MWEFATSARAEEDARWMRDCVNRYSATRCGREPACKPGDRECRSRQLAAPLERSESCEKKRDPRFPSPLPRCRRGQDECCRVASRTEDDGRRRGRHGRRALRTRVSVRECVTDVIILRNWEPPTDICKPHACESGPLARPVRTAICFWFDTTNCVAGNLLSAAPKEEEWFSCEHNTTNQFEIDEACFKLPSAASYRCGKLSSPVCILKNENILYDTS